MQNKFFMHSIKILLFHCMYFLFGHLFPIYRFTAFADTQPVIRLVCRSPDSKGFLIEYDAKDLNGDKIIINYQEAKNKYSWSCPDLLNSHRCPFPLEDHYEIKTPLFLIINDPNVNPIEFHKNNVVACNRSKPKEALSVFEYGYKTNLDKSKFGRILHQPVFGDRLALKNFPFNRIVIFGDSFSDNGKIWELSDRLGFGVWPQFFGRYSNGPVWTEQIVRKFKSFDIYMDMLNFAVSGSSVLPGLGDIPYMNIKFSDQVEQYLSILNPENQLPNVHFTIAHSLFLIMGGLADLRDIAKLSADNQLEEIKTLCKNNDAKSCANAILLNHKNSIYNGILKLIKAGGKNFMISDMPNILYSPRYSKETSASKIKFIQTFIAEYNKNITEELIPKLSNYPNIKIIKFDFFNLYEKLFQLNKQFAAQARISNVRDKCNLDLPFPTYCAKPESYLFWDEVHPTETGHCLMSERALELLYQSFYHEGGSYIPRYKDCPHSFIH